MTPCSVGVECRGGVSRSCRGCIEATCVVSSRLLVEATAVLVDAVDIVRISQQQSKTHWLSLKQPLLPPWLSSLHERVMLLCVCCRLCKRLSVAVLLCFFFCPWPCLSCWCCFAVAFAFSFQENFLCVLSLPPPLRFCSHLSLWFAVVAFALRLLSTVALCFLCICLALCCECIC